MSENLNQDPDPALPNASTGMKLGVVFLGSLPASPMPPCGDPRELVVRGHVTASVHDNRIVGNNIGVVLDGNYPYRTNNVVKDCRLFEGTVDVTFKNNDVADNLRTPSQITFTRSVAATNPNLLDPAKSPSSFQYIQKSTFSVHDPDGSLADAWLDHPVTDPIDGRTLNNHLFINGTEVPAPTRTIP